MHGRADPCWTIVETRIRQATKYKEDILIKISGTVEVKQQVDMIE